jgi:hypothetical protein
MQMKPGPLALVCMLFAALRILVVPASAQGVASLDLTSDWRIPQEHLRASPNCETIHSSISNGTSAASPKTGNGASQGLQLAIVALSPAQLRIGEEFRVTVRLKNMGLKPILVPSITDGEKVIRTSADGTEEKYEVGDVSLRLGTAKRRSMPIFLHSAGALFAHPDDPGSYLSLGHGNWVNIKFKARVECGLEECLGDIEPDPKAVLTGWWYQRVLTHRVRGCDEDHGSYAIRELSSTPFGIVVRGPSAKTPSGDSHP